MNRRVFGWFEAVFDVAYLCAAAGLGLALLRAPGPAAAKAGLMALVLAGGDAFHLAPRVAAVITGDGARLRRALGLGKLIASTTMTAFYLLLWHIGLLLFHPSGAAGLTALVYALAALRIALCLPRANGWLSDSPPLNWAIYRNIPFLLLGIAVAVLFGVHAGALPGLKWMWLAIALSFGFYLPVVVGAGRVRALGMLMLPKTLAYLWMLAMCASALPGR